MDVTTGDGAAAESAANDPVEPLDVDGVRATTVGTVLWVVALVALLPFRESLSEQDRTWWFGVCAVGALLGLAGIAYTLRRRAALRRTPS